MYIYIYIDALSVGIYTRTLFFEILDPLGTLIPRLPQPLAMQGLASPNL